ncbi:hypothetical protein ES705_45222 [subsurface metagenome]
MFSLAITATAKVKLVYWGFPTVTTKGLLPGEYEQAVIDQFEKEYPEVEIELQIIPYDGGVKKVNLSIIAGTTPDILIDNTFRMGKYADAGLLVPFDLTEEEKDDFYPSALEASTFNDKVYLYTVQVATTGMIVSKKFARDAGALDLLPLDRPDRTWTADEFKAFLQKVASAKLPGVRGIVMHFGDANGQQTFIMLMIQGFGATPFVYEDGKYRCTMDSPEAVEGLEFYLDLYNNSPGVFHEGSENLSCFDNGNFYATGKAVVGMGSLINIMLALEGKNQIYKDLDLAMFPIPSKEGISNSALLSMEAYGVFDNGDAEKAKYAQLFVRYFCENAPDFLTAHGNASPVRKSQAIAEAYRKFEDNPEVQFYLTKLASFGKDYGTMSPVYQQYKEVFRIAMQGVVTGELTAKEGLDEVARKVNKLLDEYYEE